MKDFEKIKVSIITPTYNDSRFIKETIKSILNQTHKNIELIIIDDCSTDDTFNIVKTFKDDRIVLLKNEKNCGTAYSRNLGIANASGDYIAFLDADDLWDKDKISMQLSFMIENNYDFTYTNFEVIDEFGNKNGYIFSGPKKLTHKSFMKSNYVGCLTVMYKKSVFDGLCIPNSIVKRNDYALWLKLSEKADCYLLPVVLSQYRKRNKSLSSRKIGLFHYHQLLFQKLYNKSWFSSFFFAIRNIFYFFLRNIIYKKRVNKQ